MILSILRALLYLKKHKIKLQSSHSMVSQLSSNMVVLLLLLSQVAQIHQIPALCLEQVWLQKRLVSWVCRLVGSYVGLNILSKFILTNLFLPGQTMGKNKSCAWFWSCYKILTSEVLL